jgi:hypothetical protein
MARKRMKKKASDASENVSGKKFLELKLDLFEPWENLDPDYIATRAALEAINVDRDEARPGFREEVREDVREDVLKEKRELHARHGRGSGCARHAESERRAKRAREIDEGRVRKQYPHLTSKRARAAKVREFWRQDADETPLPSLTFIRERLKTIS